VQLSRASQQAFDVFLELQVISRILYSKSIRLSKYDRDSSMSRAICAEDEQVGGEESIQQEFEEIDKLTELAIAAADVKR
jgi:hypothetical protein